MNPPNNIQNGFFTPVSPFFSKTRKLTVFSRNPHTPIILQSVRLRMERGRVIRAENPPFVPCSRRSACSACPLQFFGNKKNHMPDARGACRAYDWDLMELTPSTACELLPPPAGGPPPSRREVWGVRRSRPTALPSIGYRGFAVAPMTLRAPSRRFLYNSGCRTYEKNFGATSLSTFTANQSAIPAR